MAPHEDYSSELSCAYRRGHPIANPQPGMNSDRKPLAPVDVGDVGYISRVHGNFIRIFNVHLRPGEKGQPAEGDLPEGFEPLPRGAVSFIEDITPVFKSKSVRMSGVSADVSGPFLGGSVAFTSANERGAILAAPDPIECYDAQNIFSYKKHAMTHIESWHEFAVQRCGLDIALEDVVFVTGVDRTTSWATAIFADTRLDTQFGLQVQYATVGAQLAAKFSWHHTQNALVNSGPSRPRPALTDSDSVITPGDESREPLNRICDQSLFIRHIRAKRRIWVGLKLKANGKPENMDDYDNLGEGRGEHAATEVELVPDHHRQFSDNLEPALDFILENSTCAIAIAHDADLVSLSAGGFTTDLGVTVQHGIGMFG
ncbi:hypothetical protein PENSPDRAFT_759712 [Peniophora sp. CONT]|nr:hypothetical protein PENSPDRAFT_759712 [Peniophora sp. CONT]